MTKADCVSSTQTNAAVQLCDAVRRFEAEPPNSSAVGIMSRRGALSAFTGSAFLAVGGTAAAVSPDADTHLFILCDEFERLLKAERTADARSDVCFDRYRRNEPMPSEVLRRKLEDHTSLNLPFDHGTIGPIFADTALNSFYTAKEVTMLRHAAPPWDAGDLPRQRARVDAIVEAFERWSAERQAMRAACGLDEAIDQSEANGEARMALGDKVAAAEAKTLAGLKRKVEILHMLRRDVPVVIDAGTTNEEAIAISVIRDLQSSWSGE